MRLTRWASGTRLPDGAASATLRGIASRIERPRPEPEHVGGRSAPRRCQRLPRSTAAPEDGRVSRDPKVGHDRRPEQVDDLRAWAAPVTTSRLRRAADLPRRTRRGGRWRPVCSSRGGACIRGPNVHEASSARRSASLSSRSTSAPMLFVVQAKPRVFPAPAARARSPATRRPVCRAASRPVPAAPEIAHHGCVDVDGRPSHDALMLARGASDVSTSDSQSSAHKAGRALRRLTRFRTPPRFHVILGAGGRQDAGPAGRNDSWHWS